MTAPDRIRQLVETFEHNIHEYHSRKNETELRRQFLDPFFEALGWDVDNKKGYDERSKEVAHEYSVEIDGQQKKADYAFRTGRDTFDFLMEAKKPSVKIESNFEAAYQLRRYGWSAGLAINILTDFEHLAIYDCRTRPNYSKDKVGTGLITLIHYKDYLEKWDEISGLFSPDAIRKGSLDAFKDELKGKKGTQEVDDAFLEEIENWRETLARNIAVRNKHLNLNEDHVNYAVQMIIDRIIFLRIAEERGMEKDRRLFELSDDEDIYNNLLELFRQADARYNSGLFHFKRDKNRENPDTLTTELDVDNKVLRDILKDLYYPSPYAFNYIPTEILGSVYERFLGKVIRLTAGGNAKVEEKPEVRKAGGVYYTPSYIVDYIVKNTVGKLLEDKNPDQAASLKIVDPACGSGSFLLGAYQYLLDWHLDWYVKNDLDKQLKKKILLTADQKTYRLSIDEKKRILLNNIHGVDLDAQAVEVTKLSLLLKVVEDPGQLKMFEEGHILPNLNLNIKNGNALIGTDYFSGQMFGDTDEMKRVRPFDWKDEFPEVFRRGGFDVVIGNPPYVRMEEFKPIKSYLQENYTSHEERADFYTYFIEKASQLIDQSGLVGMIVSNKFSVAKYGRPLRATLQKNTTIHEITDFAGAKVFKGATVRTFILFFSRSFLGKEISTRYIPVPTKLEFEQIEHRILSVAEHANRSVKLLAHGQLTDAPWELVPAYHSNLLNRLKQDFPTLKQSFEWQPLFGIKTGLNDAFVLDEETRNRYVETDISSANVMQPILFGKDVKRFSLSNAKRYVIYLHPNKNPNDYPAIKRHLEAFRPQLNNRAASQQWYELQQPAVSLLPLLAKPKIVYPIIAPEPRFTLDSEGFLINDKLFVLPTDSLYLLGTLNSSLANFFFSSVCARLEGMGENYYEFRAQFVERFPIRAINFNNPAEKSMHDRMVSLVERMLALHKSAAREGIPANEKELLQRQIKSADRQIDELVYQLYGLTEDEIKIVEGD